MSLYTINHICGHEREVQIYGTDVHCERQRRADRMSAQECPECFRSTANRRGADLAATQDMPPLTGSDKQVSWATAIRANAVAELAKWRTDAESELDKHPEVRHQAQAWFDAVDQLAANTDAAWWITNCRPQSGLGLPEFTSGMQLKALAEEKALKALEDTK